MADASVSLPVQVMPMAMPQRRVCRRFSALAVSLVDTLAVRRFSPSVSSGGRQEVDGIAQDIRRDKRKD